MSRALLAALLLLAAPPLFAAQRIVALAPSLAELVCAAGACDQLVGVVAHTDYPEPAAALPQVGDAFSFSLERVLQLKPTLVLAWDGGNAREQVERLQSLKLKVQWIRVQSLDDVATVLEQLGDRLGTAPAARTAAAEFRNGLKSLAETHGQGARVRVLYQIEADPIYTVNHDSTISQAISLCGGVNVFATMPLLSAVVSREAVLAANPDVIVFARSDGVARIRADWSHWPEIAAVREGHVFAIDATTLERPAPRMLAGIRELCDVLELARPVPQK